METTKPLRIPRQKGDSLFGVLRFPKKYIVKESRSKDSRFFLGLKKSDWVLVIFTLIYLIAFTIYYLLIQNYEFMIYIAVVVFFIILVVLSWGKNNFDALTLWGLSIWGLAHMAGGSIQIGNGVLYNLHLIPIIDRGELFILRFDQVVHAFGFAVSTLVGWHLLKPYIDEKKSNYKVIYPLLICIAMGLGALNEIVEFLAVVIVPDTNVGGYFNTGLDLISNMIGSILAIFIVHFYYRRK